MFKKNLSLFKRISRQHVARQLRVDLAWSNLFTDVTGTDL
jgi:hypothetical protein